MNDFIRKNLTIQISRDLSTHYLDYWMGAVNNISTYRIVYMTDRYLQHLASHYNYNIKMLYLEETQKFIASIMILMYNRLPDVEKLQIRDVVVIYAKGHKPERVRHILDGIPAAEFTFQPSKKIL